MTIRLGFDRKIRLQWLDALVDYLLQEPELDETRSFLNHLLTPTHPGSAARRKTAGVLMGIWTRIPPEHAHMQQQALAQIRTHPDIDRRWLHWGMALMAFPQFKTTSTILGRLLAVQGDVRLAQVQQRLYEQLGHRSTLERASQRVLSSMVDWGLLSRTDTKGEFDRSAGASEVPHTVELWLVEAAFRANGTEEMEANQLLTHPMLFPFNLTVGTGDLRRSKCYVVHRQSIDMDVVALKNP